MIKKALIIVLAIVFFAPSAQAAGKKTFWGSLKSRIQGISPKKQASVTTAVGGVRGALSDEVEVVYWKGRELNEADEAELEMFNNALDLAVQGDNEAALKSFETFLEQYPESPLRLDALGAVSALRTQEQAEVPQAQPEEAQSVPEEQAAPEEEAAPDTQAAPVEDLVAPASPAAPVEDAAAPDAVEAEPGQ